jgi:4-diphosphocytidyl-2-C-methyl-D-erythritol kinase
VKVRVLAPAKINTFLAVGPPDQRGWHPLRTIYQAISLSDEMTVEVGAREPGVFCDWDGLPQENTLTKTLRLVSEAVEIPGVRVEIAKKIPAESGLGGGSSNAAALLRVLRSWMPEALPDYFLAEAAQSVGSDVPFFLVGGRAKGEGYGQILTPLEDEEPHWLVVARPMEGISTPAAYRALDSSPRDWRDWPLESHELYNDFERVAGCASLELIERLEVKGAACAGMTGSGSAVFGWFPDQSAAERAADQLRGEGVPFAVAAKTLSREESLWMS